MNYKAYEDIFRQPESLLQTLSALKQARENLTTFYNWVKPKTITLIGCGSSFYTSHSVAAAMQRRLNIPVQAVVGGDIMRHPAQFEPVLRNGLMITLSRSGSTSETLYAVQHAKERLGTPLLSIDCAPGSPLNQAADLAVSLPWAREEGVCQTRAVTNLLTAGILAGAYWAGDTTQEDELDRAAAAAASFLKSQVWKERVSKKWQDVVLLGDGELYGTASEGGLILLEMSQTPVSYYSLLDVRHGPTVMISDKTLVVLMASREGANWEADLIADLKRHGAEVLVVSAEARPYAPAGINFGAPFSDSALAVLASMVPQVLAYERAVDKGLNPDQPPDLTPWIKLEPQA